MGGLFGRTTLAPEHDFYNISLVSAFSVHLTVLVDLPQIPNLRTFAPRSSGRGKLYFVVVKMLECRMSF